MFRHDPCMFTRITIEQLIPHTPSFAAGVSLSSAGIEPTFKA
jgi:hypothetical protein